MEENNKNIESYSLNRIVVNNEAIQMANYYEHTRIGHSDSYFEDM